MGAFWDKGGPLGVQEGGPAMESGQVARGDILFEVDGWWPPTVPHYNTIRALFMVLAMILSHIIKRQGATSSSRSSVGGPIA